MPLKKAGGYRGENAIHVRDHGKILKHRTIIKEAVPLVNWLIDKPEVTMIALGKMATAATRPEPRAVCHVPGKRIHLLLVGRRAMQTMRVTTRSKEIAETVAAQIEERWAEEMKTPPE